MYLIHFNFDCRIILGYKSTEIMKTKEKKASTIVACRKKCFTHGKMCLNSCQHSIYTEIST